MKQNSMGSGPIGQNCKAPADARFLAAARVVVDPSLP